MADALKPGQAEVAQAEVRADKGPKIREAGAERMANMAEGAKGLAGGAVKFMKDGWNKTGDGLKGGWNWLKQKAGEVGSFTLDGAKQVFYRGPKRDINNAISIGKAGLEYAFGAPEAIKAAAKGTKAGAEFVGRKTVEGAKAGKDAVVGAAARSKERVVSAKDAVMDKTRAGYEALAGKGKEAYGGARARVATARDNFNGWRNERRTAKLAAFEAKQEMKKQALLDNLKEQAAEKKGLAAQLREQIKSINQAYKEISATPATQLAFK